MWDKFCNIFELIWIDFGVFFFFGKKLNQAGFHRLKLSWFGELPYFEKVLPVSDPYSSSEVIVSHS